MPEKELIANAQSGNRSAFEELVRKNEKAVYNYCLRMCGNREDAYDISQEVFLKVWKTIGSFKGDSKFATWLYRLTRNTCIDFLRKCGKEKTVPIYRTDENGEESIIDIQDPGQTPEETAVSRSELEEIMSAMQNISEDYREILILRDIKGLSYGEISELAGIELGTVKSRISRARTELCKVLLKNGNKSLLKSSNKKGRER